MIIHIQHIILFMKKKDKSITPSIGIHTAIIDNVEYWTNGRLSSSQPVFKASFNISSQKVDLPDCRPLTSLCISVSFKLTRRCREVFSRWECGFYWKLCCCWLEGLRRRRVAVIMQGPGIRAHLLYTFTVICDVIDKILIYVYISVWVMI